MLNLPRRPCFAEAEAEGLAPSWGFYSGLVGTHHHGFLQDLRDQAHEVHFLDMMCKANCLEGYMRPWVNTDVISFKKHMLLCELAEYKEAVSLVNYYFLT